MITKVVMPQLSLSMREGIVNKWYKQEGDFIEKGEVLCEIEADKATTDFEAPASGFIKKIVAEEGREFPVREVMVYLGDAADVIPDDPPEVAAVSPAGAPPGAPPKESQAQASRKILATPVAKRLAAEHGIDLATLKGSGPEGLIGREDVLAARDAKPPAEGARGDETFEPRGIKKLVAERMLESYRSAPHIHLTLSVDMSQAAALRERLNQEPGKRITYTDMLVWAIARTLRKHPLLNAVFQGGQITLYAGINVSIAVAAEKGLIVPVIQNADALALAEIAARREALVERAKAGKQTPEDISGGTFTLTNLGMFGVEQFDAIINPGQAAILSVGKIRPSAVVDSEGGIAVRPVATMTLGCDHRVVDGSDGARFLADLQALLEAPEPMAEGLL